MINLLTIALFFCCGFSVSAQPVDKLILGDLQSEKAHALFAPEGVSVITNHARIILPPKAGGWASERITFRMAVHPQQQNYSTVVFRNAEVNNNLLFLFIDNKQIGYRPLGDYDVLCGPNTAPLAREGYFSQTVPLPIKMTQGQTAITLSIGATGWIWPYGTTFDQYQRAMTTPSRGICVVMTAVDAACFAPSMADKKTEQAPCSSSTLNPSDLLKQVQSRVDKDIQSILRKKTGSCNQMELHLLVKAFHTHWSQAYHNPKVVEQVIASIDTHFRRYRTVPAFLYSDASTWNPSWYGFGVLGECIMLLEKEMAPVLDTPISDEKEASLSRRVAWSELLQASLTYLRTHRRQYTNQAMISDLNLYRSNRGLRIVDPSKALPEQEAIAYLHEAIGILPWLGSDDDQGRRTKPLGDHFYQVTRQGLTRELGYVGGYGEVLDWVVQLYDATREGWRGKGDPRVKDQLTKLAKTRAVFRYPSTDDEGSFAMRMETVIGWRDMGLIGPVVYGAKMARDATALAPAAVAQDPWSVGYAQQMLSDNQFFRGLKEHLHGGGLRVTLGLIDFPEDYAWLMAQPKSPYRLPMSPGEPDFLFSDLEDGVIALKHGTEILYVSLYWRALFGINRLAKIHYMAPGMDHRATVVQHVEFANSGKTYRRPKNTDAGYGRGPYKQYLEIPSAHEGEELPIAQFPADVAGSYKVGLGNLFAGRATFYHMQYGPYVCAMNCDPDKTYTLQLPAGNYRELPNGSTTSGCVSVAPQSTRVWSKE